MLAPDDGSNSFYVGLDEQNPQEDRDDYYVYAMPANPEPVWDDVSMTGTGTVVPLAPEFDPMVWSLEAGAHVFTFNGREMGARLDQIVLRAAQPTSSPDGNDPAGDANRQPDDAGGVDAPLGARVPVKETGCACDVTASSWTNSCWLAIAGVAWIRRRARRRPRESATT